MAGPGFGEFFIGNEVPDTALEVTYSARVLIECVEASAEELCGDAVRRIRGSGLDYRDGEGNHFMTIYPGKNSIRIIFDGPAEAFPDDHGLLKAAPSELGEDRVEFVMRNMDQKDIARDYVIVALSRINYFKPPKHGRDEEDEEYVIELTKGNYEGPIVDGKPCGKGKFTWDDGTVYEGTLVNGQVTGSGTITKPNGDVFRANFVNGRASPEKEGEKEAKAADTRPVYTFGYIF